MVLYKKETENIYPFAAIVGQDRLKKALILCAVQPRISGLLIRGEKGTAKSTAVRALAALLPEIETVAGCPLGCDPNHPEKFCALCRTKINVIGILRHPVRVITLPLNATEDRVTGGIDFDRAVKTGQRSFQPGLLAAAHRGILYVDEVNLLDDHLADIILDAAASGINRVEREGVSFIHPAQFVLVGTMNPEEGELRPQFLDRFGLCVEVAGEKDPELRRILMERREAFDLNPAAFFQQWRSANRELASRISAARDIVSKVSVSYSEREQIAGLCKSAGAAGHRADIMMELTACAICAWDGRAVLSESDIQEAASYVLPHRKREVRKSPPETHQARENAQPPKPETADPAQPEKPDQREPHTKPEKPELQDGSAEDRIFAIGQTFSVKRLHTPKDRLARRGSGRRSRTRSAQKTGRYVRSVMSRDFSDLALDATLRAAAPCQKQRAGQSDLKVMILKQDVRKKVREKRTGNDIVFVVDASGSMAARKRMIAAKGAIMSLLLDAYRMRDRIAMIAFRKTGAELLLPPTNSIVTAARLLSDLPVGGRTPLSAGLAEGYKTAKNRIHKDPLARPILIFITDGRSNVAMGENNNPVSEAFSIASGISKDSRMTCVVIDTEPDGYMKFHLAARLANAMSARHFKIEDIRADDLVRVVKEFRHA